MWTFRCCNLRKLGYQGFSLEWKWSVDLHVYRCLNIAFVLYTVRNLALIRRMERKILYWKIHLFHKKPKMFLFLVNFLKEVQSFHSSQQGLWFSDEKLRALSVTSLLLGFHSWIYVVLQISEYWWSSYFWRTRKNKKRKSEGCYCFLSFLFLNYGFPFHLPNLCCQRF